MLSGLIILLSAIASASLAAWLGARAEERRQEDILMRLHYFCGITGEEEDAA